MNVQQQKTKDVQGPSTSTVGGDNTSGGAPANLQVPVAPDRPFFEYGMPAWWPPAKHARIRVSRLVSMGDFSNLSVAIEEDCAGPVASTAEIQALEARLDTEIRRAKDRVRARDAYYEAVDAVANIQAHIDQIEARIKGTTIDEWIVMRDESGVDPERTLEQQKDIWRTHVRDAQGKLEKAQLALADRAGRLAGLDSKVYARL